MLTSRNSFAESIIKATKGEKGIVEPTYVYLPGVPGGEAIAKETGVDYFSVPVELGVCPFLVVSPASTNCHIAKWSRKGHQYLDKRKRPREEAA